MFLLRTGREYRIVRTLRVLKVYPERLAKLVTDIYRVINLCYSFFVYSTG